MSRPSKSIPVRSRRRALAIVTVAALLSPLITLVDAAPPASAATEGFCPAPLELDTNKDSGMLAGVPVDVNQSQARLAGVPELRELRGIMWDRNPPFVPWGSNTTRTLRQVAAQEGIKTRTEYINAVQWDQHLDFMALERIAESSYNFPQFLHQRTNGGSIYTITRNGYGLSGENLQWNGMDSDVPSIIVGAIDWWGVREYDALKAANGRFNSANGHLHTLIDPSHTGVAFAVNQDNGMSVALVADRPAVSGQSSVQGDQLITVGVSPSAVYASPPQVVAVGSRVGFVLAPYSANASCIHGTFSSSHPSIATVSADGVVTGLRHGATTITFRSGTQSYQFRVAVKPPARVSGGGFAFTDVSFNRPFFSEISWLAQQGLTTGNGSGEHREYRPDTSISRGAMAAFMYRLAGSPAFTPPSVSPFTDVSTNHPFYREITWLAAQGITSGWKTDAGVEFRPGNYINRDAMAAFMYRFEGSPAYSPPAQSPFADVATSRAFYKEIAWLAQTGISEGWQSGSKVTFRPFSQVQRDAMAAFVYRLSNL